MKKHILITGGAGFIGSHLTDALVQRGYEVTVLDKKSPAESLYVHPDAGVLRIDLTHPEAMALVKALAPDVIVHLAANANVAKSVADPAMDAEINYLATVRLLETAKDLGVEKFIFTSTGGALSSEHTVLPTPEDRPAEPLSPYARHKLASEQMGAFYAKTHGLPFVALRPANVYGPRQSPTQGEANVIATFAERMQKNEQTVVNGTGLLTRDYVYIDDVVRAIVLALENEDTLGIFNIGSGTETTVLDIHRLVAKASGYPAAPVHGPAAKGEPQRSCLDITKANTVLGWRPTVRLEDGIERTVAWVGRENTKPVAIEAA